MQIAKAKAIAEAQINKIEQERYEKDFLFTLAIPLNVLVSDYWPKSAKQKAPEFIAKVASLYESVLEGVVTPEQLAELLKEYAHVEIEAEWMKHKMPNKADIIEKELDNAIVKHRHLLEVYKMQGNTQNFYEEKGTVKALLYVKHLFNPEEPQ